MKKVALGLLVLGQLSMADYIVSWGQTDYSDSQYTQRKFGIKLNTGRDIWASLGKSGSCDTVSTSIDMETRCGGVVWAYSCNSGGGQKTVLTTIVRKM